MVFIVVIIVKSLFFKPAQNTKVKVMLCYWYYMDDILYGTVKMKSVWDTVFRC